MKVLGLNGVYSRSHDSSACLIDGQEILAFAEEERFLRSKRAFDKPPHNSIAFCIESSGIDINEIDLITYGWKGDKLDAKNILPLNISKKLTKNISIEQVPHHEAHAASVFYTSPFEESAIVIVDGQGESESTTIWKGTQEGLEKVATFGIEKSLGYFYSAISKYCGLGTFGAGKLMGLAPYGNPKYIEDLQKIYESITLAHSPSFDSQNDFLNQFCHKLQMRGFEEVKYSSEFDSLTNSYKKIPKIEQIHKDIAASAQKFLENEMITIAHKAKELTGMDYLCLAGGVAMNCVSNSVVQDSNIFKDTFLQPGCEDSGIALGSALAITKQKTPLTSIYTGPSYTNQQIGDLLSSLNINATRHEDVSVIVAQMLSENKIVGWFQGRMEYGPRALGGRSILANPSVSGIQDNVNNVKRRELWRPFGPSVLEEDTGTLFEKPHESKYMLRSFTVKEEWRDKLLGITHIDGSTRPQTVAENDNPEYYRMIKSFGDLTDVPGVINTSFNSYNEPIVGSPLDAIRAFYSTGIGALALGEFLIVK